MVFGFDVTSRLIGSGVSKRQSGMLWALLQPSLSRLSHLRSSFTGFHSRPIYGSVGGRVSSLSRDAVWSGGWDSFVPNYMDKSVWIFLNKASCVLFWLWFFGLISSYLLWWFETQRFGRCILQPSSCVSYLSGHRKNSTWEIILKVSLLIKQGFQELWRSYSNNDRHCFSRLSIRKGLREVSRHVCCGKAYKSEKCIPLKVRLQEHRKAVIREEIEKSAMADDRYMERKGKR